MRLVLLVGLGGFVGSAARYVVGEWVHRGGTGGYPYGTLVVNVLGCAAIGLLAGALDARPTPSAGLRAFLVVGVLGGFTTFSTFAHETLALARAADVWRAGGHVVLHVVTGLAAAGVGYTVTRG